MLNLYMRFNVSADQLDSFSKEFWKSVGDANVFAFHGAMGAGKTTIIKELCRIKGVKETVSSPTFSIINAYSFTKKEIAGTIYHIDLYRLDTKEEIIQTGVEEYLESGNICMVEWPEKAPWLFGQDAIHIFIETTSVTNRQIELKAGYLPDAM